MIHGIKFYNMIINILIVGLFVFGVHSVLRGFFDFFDFDIDIFYANQNKAIQFILRPTVYCNACMSSVWGSIGYFLVFDCYLWPSYILTLICCASVVQIITKYT